MIKKTILYIIIFLIANLLCCSNKERIKAPVAQNGILDLRNWDLKKDGPVKLDGEWNFFWEEFVPPEKINEKRNSLKIEVPSNWDSQKVKGGKIKGTGYATYHLKVLLNPIDTPLAIKFPVIGTAYEAYVNGKRINQVGKVGKSFETMVSTYRPEVVDFFTKDNQLDLVIHISNFYQQYSEVRYSLNFGHSRDLVKMREQAIQMSHFLIGVFVIMFFYHIGLVLLRPKEKLPLYFALICLSLAIRISFMEEMTILSIIPEISLSWIKTVEYLTFYLPLPFLTIFVYELFIKESNKIIMICLNIPVILSIIITIFVPLNIFVYSLVYVQGTFLLMCLYCVYIIVLATIRKREGAKIFIFSFLIIIIFSVNDVLYSQHLLNTGYFVSYGLLVVIFSQSYLLSAKFSKAFFAVEELTLNLELKNFELQDLNINLEQRVEERTNKLEEANVKLKEMDKLKTNFFTNISHEIRTPLTLILSPVETVIQEGYKKNLDKDFFDSIQRNAIRLLRIVNNILDFSKIEAGRMSIRIQEIDIINVMKNYVDMIRASAKSKDIDISFKSSIDSLFIYLDIEKVDKIGMNLLSNALKFTEKGGKIEVGIYEDDKNCYIDFKDTGIGIPENMLEAIFDRFSQADGSSTRKYEGTGIGLSLVKELVEMHNGTISVKSKHIYKSLDDHGSTFTVAFLKGKSHFEKKPDMEFITVDVQEESISDRRRYYGMREMIEFVEPDIEITDVKETVGVNGDKETQLLVVEDNSDMRKFLNNLLKKSYQVIFAVDGLDGLNKAKELRPDLIVTDVMMPRMDGYQMTKVIKEDEELKRIPVLMLTAKAEIAQKIEGLEYGADDYLTKPFNSKELMVRLKTLLEKRESQRIIEDRKDEIEEELETARLLQRKLLPEKIPELSGYKSHVTYIPMDRVGGDFYDFKADDEKIELFIADVSGHGLPGAFLSMIAKMSFESVGDRKKPKIVLDDINEVICRSTVKDNYITFFYCHLDRKSNKMTYSNAGHFPPFVYRKKNDEFFELNTKGLPLGWFKSLNLEEKTIQLEQGDRVLLYTDGIIECSDVNGERYTDDHFKEFIRTNSKLLPGEFSEKLLKDLREFSGMDEFDDDLCLLVMDIL